MSDARASQYDVLILGGGAAGLATAVAAAHAGLSVLVLEKSAKFGGTAARSGGCVWVPGNHIAAEQGICDSLENVLRYLEATAKDTLDVAKTQAFWHSGADAVRFFHENTALKFEFGAGYPDYYPVEPGGVDKGRSLYSRGFDGRELGPWLGRLAEPIAEHTFLGMGVGSGADFQHFLRVTKSLRSAAFVGRRLLAHGYDVLRYGRTTNLVNGQAFAGRLLKAALEAGVTLMAQAEVVSLMSAEGRVMGVRMVHQGQPHELMARKGVVVATGGFAWSAAHQQRLYPHVALGASHRSLADPACRGEGIELAMAAGAAFDAALSDAAAWSPASRVPRKDGSSGMFFHLIDRAKPGTMAVTSEGTRFVNESVNYHEFVRAMIGQIRARPQTRFFMICDRRAMKSYGLGAVRPFPVPHRHHLKSGYLKRAATISELARQLAMPAHTLEQSVLRLNAAAAMGYDAEFGKGSDGYQRYMGDRGFANPCLGPLARGPFYAVEIFPSDLGTFAGLKTDPRTRVIDAQGDAIEGLYAVGNDAASLFGGAYPGAGATLGPALTFGYICAQTLKAT